MSLPALVVENVGKAYVEYSSELRRVARWFGASTKPKHEHWVIRDISFRVERGDSVGIIGQNGAGKSTLLKMITGTTRPTEGQIALHGRVSALLELGLGFNPELTGRENAIYSAGLMGLSRNQIEELIPSIESFAEIGEYFDQPMRTYSSGMQMRVAFSVATVVRPEILIVDEALSVGDAYFVHKCFKRIREFREAGTTLLIVSHDASAIQTLCDRAILIDSGRLMLDGDPQQVLDYYNALIAEKENSTVRTTRTLQGSVATESGTGEAQFESLQLIDADGEPVEYITVGQAVTLRARISIEAPIEQMVFGYMIRDRLGQPVFGTNTHHTDQICEDLVAGDIVEVRAQFPANFGPGSYSISVALTDADTHLVKNYQWRDLAMVFTVSNVAHPKFVGSAWVPPHIEVVRASTGSAGAPPSH
ncbi:ABC transporter ATP-binding protein [Dyella sp.]|uniref:ABC transporter ATP-binding protein n=1 Tax=Dyella sp. TaxID=1869338 RepID=UPI00284C69E3|nr:ABC transporter ATP-binding protein [Dyella sp.]MDR3444402.1 ABC transporter ATP-binding protein [Dyella sp.]